MPVHDWTRVDPGIFHSFHLRWIAAIGDALNGGLLPDDYYALAEQRGGKTFEADVLTLERADRSGSDAESGPFSNGGAGGGTALAVAAPVLAPTAEASLAFYRRKQSALVVRHVSGDRMVAVIEIVSPGNKSGRTAFRDFVDKSTSLLMNGIHLLIVDLFPPGKRDPDGLHAAIWDDAADEPDEAPAGPLPDGKPLAAMAYEVGTGLRAYVQPMGVGDPVPAVPLFLGANAYVMPPLDETYRTAFGVMPRRWREVLEAP
jgi:hypothetical protein